MTSRIVASQGVMRPLFWLATPVLLEQLLNAMVGFVDTWLAGHYVPGAAPMAAIGFISYMMWTLPNLFATVSIGATAIVSRLVGAARPQEARHAANQAMTCGIVLATIITGLLVFGGERLVAVMQLHDDAASLTNSYLTYLIPAIPAIMLVQVCTACLRGAGDTVSGLIAMTFVNATNAVVSAGLVTGWGPFPQLGWIGLAIGTSIGQYVGAALLVGLLVRGRAGVRLQWVEMLPDRSLIQRLLKVGIPGGLDIALIQGCHLWFVGLINSLGTLATAAHMLAIRIESLAYLPGAAFQVAAATMTGQFLGANEPRRARQSVIAACGVGGLIMTGAGVLFFTIPQSLTGFFLSRADSPTGALASTLLPIAAFAMPPLALAQIVAGGLRGAGDTRVTLLIAMIGFLVVRIPITYLLTQHEITLPIIGIDLPTGLYGAWAAMIADIFLRAALLSGRWWHGGWSKLDV